LLLVVYRNCIPLYIPSPIPVPVEYPLPENSFFRYWFLREYRVYDMEGKILYTSIPARELFIDTVYTGGAYRLYQQ
jgi:hypothetical protein